MYPAGKSFTFPGPLVKRYLPIMVSGQVPNKTFIFQANQPWRSSVSQILAASSMPARMDERVSLDCSDGGIWDGNGVERVSIGRHGLDCQYSS